MAPSSSLAYNMQQKKLDMQQKELKIQEEILEELQKMRNDLSVKMDKLITANKAILDKFDKM